MAFKNLDAAKAVAIKHLDGLEPNVQVTFLELRDMFGKASCSLHHTGESALVQQLLDEGRVTRPSKRSHMLIVAGGPVQPTLVEVVEPEMVIPTTTKQLLVDELQVIDDICLGAAQAGEWPWKDALGIAGRSFEEIKRCSDLIKNLLNIAVLPETPVAEDAPAEPSTVPEEKSVTAALTEGE